MTRTQYYIHDGVVPDGYGCPVSAAIRAQGPADGARESPGARTLGRANYTHEIIIKCSVYLLFLCYSFFFFLASPAKFLSFSRESPGLLVIRLCRLLSYPDFRYVLPSFSTAFRVNGFLDGHFFFFFDHRTPVPLQPFAV